MKLKIGIATCFLLLLASWGCVQVEKSEAGHPNVILIMTDDQGYGDMSCNGHPLLKTPNLDRLYDEGIHFTDFHVSTYCTPTRASLMTGCDYRRVGAWYTFGGRNYLYEDATTIADVFKYNGYATGHFGKWHLGDNYPYAPQFRGFDTSLMLGNSGLGATDDYWDNDRFDDTYFLNGKPIKTKGFCTDVFVDNALKFIDDHKDKPFFVYLATNVPHKPWNIPSTYRNKYDPANSDTREVFPYAQLDMARFYGTIDKIDEQVGRVLDFLEEKRLDKNTIVLFLTDNGTVSLEYNAGMRGRKASAYEGGHRVPLFIRWGNGNFKCEKEIKELTCHMDIFPTLIDLCRLKTEKDLSFDGQSLKPLLDANYSNWNNDRTYVTQFTSGVPGGYHITLPKWGNTVVCKQQWRLVNNEELYNLQGDPGEDNNVAERYPEVVEELKKVYEENWKYIQPYTEKIARVHIGDEKQAVSTFSLTNVTPCEGYLGDFWSIASAVNAIEIDGKWPVYVEQTGQYEIELRRWPKELDQPINAYEGLGGTVPITEFQTDAIQISPDSAIVRIEETYISRKIDPNEKSIRFQVSLNRGMTDLQTWFIDKDGTTRIAYWVYVRKI